MRTVYRAGCSFCTCSPLWAIFYGDPLSLPRWAHLEVSLCLSMPSKSLTGPCQLGAPQTQHCRQALNLDVSQLTGTSVSPTQSVAQRKTSSFAISLVPWGRFPQIHRTWEWLFAGVSIWVSCFTCVSKPTFLRSLGLIWGPINSPRAAPSAVALGSCFSFGCYLFSFLKAQLYIQHLSVVLYTAFLSDCSWNGASLAQHTTLLKQNPFFYLLAFSEVENPAPLRSQSPVFSTWELYSMFWNYWGVFGSPF